MIISYLNGGLGNQMFQYAAGHALALRHGVQHKVDVSAFCNYRLREFSLDVFRAEVEIASEFESRNLKYETTAFAENAFRALFRLPKRLKRNVYTQPFFHFDPDFKTLGSNTYLIGSFQSERYFYEIADEIRALYEPRKPADSLNAEYAQNISLCNSVSIHVRRGDYVSNPKTNAFHGTCSRDYYLDAISLIAGNVSRPVFYVFSDDIAWVRENLCVDYPVVFVEHNSPGNAHEDLCLMSHCKHHIIANSTFSWWGAWLCRNPDKIVFAPRQWFRDSDIDTRDLIPPRWCLL